MRQLVRQYKKDAAIRQLALQLTKELDQKDYAGEAKALQAYVRDQIRYVRDVTDVETLQTPDKTLEYGAGDCDDKSTLLAALLESIGHPTGFVAVGPNSERFVHVYTVTRIGQNYVPLETTEPVDIGWAPNGLAGRLVIYN